MANFRLTNERGEPLIGVVVEARSSSGQILARANTNMNGVVSFPNTLPKTGWSPKANLTRYSGKAGDMSLNGEINIQPYAEENPIPKFTPASLSTKGTVLSSYGLTRDNLLGESVPPPGGEPDVPKPEEPKAIREAGMVRYLNGHLEYWSGGAWVNFNTLPSTQPADNTAVWLDCP